MNAAAELQAACKHRRIQSWNYGDGEPAGMWSCVDCGHKFAPLDLEQEKDALRYRWLRDVATGCDWGRIGNDTGPTTTDAAIDEEIKRQEYMA